jgi:cytochrome c oxidase subunit 3
MVTNFNKNRFGGSNKNFPQTYKSEEHPFHLVDFSPWPFLLSIFILLTIVNGVAYMHNDRLLEAFAFYKFFFFLMFSVLILCFWFRDIIREATFEGHHTMAVQRGIRLGMILFIISEIMFFFSFFWAFFHSSLVPAIQIGCVWPPKGIKTFNTWGVPFLNTIILLSSGATITVVHYAILSKLRNSANNYLIITIFYGVIFTFFQAYEYISAPFDISDGIFGSTFYLLTGFHGFHVLIGTIFLIVCLYRQLMYHFTRTSHVGFECAAWYWHFVDIVWIILFICLYWWGGSGDHPAPYIIKLVEPHYSIGSEGYNLTLIEANPTIISSELIIHSASEDCPWEVIKRYYKSLVDALDYLWDADLLLEAIVSTLIFFGWAFKKIYAFVTWVKTLTILDLKKILILFLYSFSVFFIIFNLCFFTFNSFIFYEIWVLFFLLVILLLISTRRNTLSFFYKVSFIIYTQFILLNELYFLYIDYSFFFDFLNFLNRSSFFYNEFFITSYFLLNIKFILFFIIIFLINFYVFFTKKVNVDYLLILLFLSLGLFLLISSNNYLAFYVSLELISFSLYILIGIENKNIYSIEASLKYFVLNSLASGITLFAIFFFFYNLGSLDFNNIEHYFFYHQNFSKMEIFGYICFFNKVFVAQFLIFIVLCFKLGLAPLHFWALDVYEGSSLLTMIFMLTVVKFCYFFMFIRLFVFVPSLLQKEFSFFIYLFAFFSLIVGSFLALRQKRLKRLLVYSSITNMGYVFLLINTNLYFSVVYFIIYILSSLFFFCILYYFKQYYRLIYITDLKYLKNNFLFIFFFFIFSAIPPSPLFFLKSILIMSLYGNNDFLKIFLIIFSSLISLFYYLRLIVLLTIKK